MKETNPKEQVAKEQIWAEIRDLLEFQEGPLSVFVRKQFNHMRHSNPKEFRNISKKYGISSAMEYMRCQMISERVAVIASAVDSPYKLDPPSTFLSAWANGLAERETNALLGELFKQGGDIHIIHMVIPPDEEDEDDE